MMFEETDSPMKVDAPTGSGPGAGDAGDYTSVEGGRQMSKP
jgi:hypothetical protein